MQAGCSDHPLHERRSRGSQAAGSVRGGQATAAKAPWNAAARPAEGTSGSLWWRYQIQSKLSGPGLGQAAAAAAWRRAPKRELLPPCRSLPLCLFNFPLLLHSCCSQQETRHEHGVLVIIPANYARAAAAAAGGAAMPGGAAAAAAGGEPHAKRQRTAAAGAAQPAAGTAEEAEQLFELQMRCVLPALLEVGEDLGLENLTAGISAALFEQNPDQEGPWVELGRKVVEGGVPYKVRVDGGGRRGQCPAAWFVHSMQKFQPHAC